MREIKFRAWDKKYNCWFNGFYVDWQSGEVRWKLANNSAQGVNEDVELMQYTGVKDKNGKEIYEGDIMSPAENLRGYGNQVVQWVDDLPGFIFGEELSPDECQEVIGNIYENPELIEENKND